MLAHWKETMTNLDSIFKSRDITLLTKVHIVKAMVFPVVLIWELNHKEGWEPKNWCFRSVVLGKTLESPLDCKEIQWVHPKGDESWVFIGRTDVEAETPILWSPDSKSQMIGKDPDAEGRRRSGQQRMRWLNGITNSMYMSLVNSGSWWCTGRPGVLQFMGSQRGGHNWVTELNWCYNILPSFLMSNPNLTLCKQYVF